MSLRIRLSRGGAKKRPYYHIVIADSRSSRDGRYIERVGTYNPMLAKDNADRVKLKEDRIKHWLGEGALPSDRVQKFLATVGIMEAAIIHPQTKQDKPRAKTLERMKEAEDKKKSAEEAAVAAIAAAAEAAAAPAPVEEAPAEEAVAEEAPAPETVAEDAAPETPAEEAVAEEAPAPEAVAEDAAPAEEEKEG